MSTPFEKQTDDYNICINWLNRAMVENFIKYYDYSEFKNIKEINSNHFEINFQANWENGRTLFVVKSHKLTVKEIVNEVFLFS